MAIKTFTSGEILTASDTNTYLNNGGLVYIGEYSATSGSSLSVNNCFTSTYTSYRIVLRRALISTGEQSLFLKLRVSGTDSVTAYYWGTTGYYSTNTTANDYGANNGNGFQIGYISTFNTAALTLDVLSPQLAVNTQILGSYTFYVQGSGAIGARFIGGSHLVATAYDGFTLTTAGTITNLNVALYGYRQA